MKIQLKRSNQLESGEAKEPTLEFMEYGELAVNYNSQDPAIFIKTTDGAGGDAIVRIADTSDTDTDTDTPEVPDASETVKGIVELATAAETSAGSDTTRAVHPFGFNSALTSALIPYAKLNSPAFTGVPTAPTAPVGTNNTQLATTAFVQSAVSSNSGGGSTPPNASETVTGIVRLANSSETSAGSSRTLAVNPANLIGALANYPYRSEVLLLNVTTEQKVQGDVNFQDQVYVQHNLACNNTDRQAAFTANNSDATETIAIQTRTNQFYMTGGYAIKNYTYPDGILRSYIDKYGNIWGNTLTSVYIAGATIGVTSDQKYKTNITDYNVSELSDIKTLGQSLKYYYWNQDAYVRDEERNVQQFGLIAQEVEAIDSSLVKTAYKKNDTIITPEQTDENGNFLAAAVTETTEESYKTIDLGVLVSKILKATSEVIVKSEAMEAALSSINTAASTAGTLEQLKSDIASATSNF